MDLFSYTNEIISMKLINTNTCGKCNHIERHQCNSIIVFYCGIRKNKRTTNGQLKVKCKTISCNLFCESK